MATWTLPSLMFDNILEENKPIEVFIDDTNENIVFRKDDNPIIVISYEDFLDIVNFLNKQMNG
jgi:hypothetical protein